ELHHCRLSVIPVPLNLDSRPMTLVTHGSGDIGNVRLGKNSDALDEVPRKRALDQELRLLALFHCSRHAVASPLSCFNRIPVDVAQVSNIAAILKVTSARIREGKRPTHFCAS